MGIGLQSVGIGVVQSKFISLRSLYSWKHGIRLLVQETEHVGCHHLSLSVIYVQIVAIWLVPLEGL